MKRTLAVLILILTLCAAVALAQEEATTTATTTATSTEAPDTVTKVVEATNASETRSKFHQLLERHPPSVGRVLKLDPTLFRNADYLATYPAIAEFVKTHPEVAHSPAYYLEWVYVPGDQPARSASERIWEDAFEGIAIFFTVSLIVGTLTWLIRTLVQHRRWSRLSRVQAEVHGKLMDRFATNEDLLKYIQTPAGKRFLESAPLQLDATPVQRPIASPASRILWSIQIGVVLAVIGIGMQFISANIAKEPGEPMFAFGVLALATGLGFVLAAFISYVVSRKLGIWPNPAEPSASPSE